MENSPELMPVDVFNKHLERMSYWTAQEATSAILSKEYPKAVDSANWWKFCLGEVTDKLNDTIQQKIELRKELEEAKARIVELESQAAIGRRAVVSGLAVGEPFAWATFDGEGGYDLRLYEGNESYRDDWQAVNHRFRDWVIPLYDAEPDPATVAVDAGALEALREAVGYLDKQPVHLLSISRARAEVLVIEAARRLLAGGE